MLGRELPARPNLEQYEKQAKDLVKDCRASKGERPTQQDAFSVAKWMQVQDCGGDPGAYHHPSVEARERQRAEIEGWILGVL
ncbi:MAG TPA: hypothetical protein VN862_07800 [Candidatus Acidoferrales bacterium]|nr:hypothetical protein [Candidatus Acidoferrales bacterium]